MRRGGKNWPTWATPTPRLSSWRCAKARSRTSLRCGSTVSSTCTAPTSSGAGRHRTAGDRAARYQLRWGRSGERHGHTWCRTARTMRSLTKPGHRLRGELPARQHGFDPEPQLRTCAPVGVCGRRRLHRARHRPIADAGRLLRERRRTGVPGAGRGSARLPQPGAIPGLLPCRRPAVEPGDRPAAQRLRPRPCAEVLKATNANVVWSEGLLKFIPYGDTALTGNGKTFTPNLTPLYALNDDAFVVKTAGDPPLQVDIQDQSDAYSVDPARISGSLPTSMQHGHRHWLPTPRTYAQYRSCGKERSRHRPCHLHAHRRRRCSPRSSTSSARSTFGPSTSSTCPGPSLCSSRAISLN